MLTDRDLYRTVELSEILTKDGYVVAVEGDTDLYDEDLGEWLKKNVKNYILLNKIYDNPKKLLELKDLKIDVFIFQTTGLNPLLQKLIDYYIAEVANYPKHFITVSRDGEEHFYKIFEEMDSYEVYRYDEVDEDSLYITRQEHSCKML